MEYVFVHTHARAHTHMHIHACIHTYVCTHKYTHMHICVYIPTYLYMCIYIHLFVCLGGGIRRQYSTVASRKKASARSRTLPLSQPSRVPLRRCLHTRAHAHTLRSPFPPPRALSRAPSAPPPCSIPPNTRCAHAVRTRRRR